VPARQAAVLEQREHRDRPPSDEPWLMAQTWEDLLFAHWRVPADELEALLPAGIELDRFEGNAWLGLTAFRLTNLRLRGTLPLPFVSSFPELNVRTCVSVNDVPGIWFFSLDTSSPLAVAAARRLYKLPYQRADISMMRLGERIDFAASRLDTEPRPFAFSGQYRPAGEVSPPAPGSLEHFLTERYRLYSAEGESLFRAEIHHRPWPLQPAAAGLELNTMAPEGVTLPDDEPVLHFSRRLDALIWSLEPA
jgi:uncharacterized protein